MKRVFPALLVVAAAVIALQVYGCHERKVGELRASIRARDVAIVGLAKRVATVDTVYRKATDTLRVVRTRTDTLLDTLRLTDTLIHRDTVIRIVERERLACDAVVASCEARVAVRDTLIDSLKVQLKAERGRDRLFHVKLPGRTTMFGIGIGLGLLLGR